MKPARYQLKDHPWIALIIVLLTLVFFLVALSIVMFGIIKLNPDDSINQTLPAAFSNLILLFFVIPLLFKLPRGNGELKHYLDDIGLLKLKPFLKLLLIGLTCYLIFLISQAAGTIIFRLSEGYPISREFIGEMFRFSGEFPPNSNGWLVSLPSILEEFVFRGVILTMFLNKYSSTKAIVFSALSFGFIHLLNLAGDKELIWVLGQVIWASVVGLFYGYLFFRTRSLVPVALVHYLGNLFIGTITGYFQSNASVEMQSIYGIVFFFGIIPTTLSMLWIRSFLRKWPIQL
jgi:membrane protease YdiL (CAAX protease family)